MIDAVGKTMSALLLAAFLSACGNDAPPAPPPIEVDVVTVAPADRMLDFSYTARTRGTREVDVRARVSGLLERRFYREGDRVEAGDVLFRIDPAPYAAAVRSAEARLGVERARVTEAERQNVRIVALHDRGFVSGRNRDIAEADLGGARSAAAAARADLDRARLDLSYTTVRAPISGETGLESRSEGSLIDATSADSSLLTTITQSSQLYVDFGMPRDEAEQVRAAIAKGPVRLQLSGTDSRELLATASITFIDTRIDPDTGTVAVRATLDNAPARLSPGQFVRAAVIGIAAPTGLYIPAKAVMLGDAGSYLWKVDRKGTAAMHPVVTGQRLGNLVRVERGIAAGDRIVVNGMLKLQPGAAVKPVPVDASRAATE